MFNVIHEKKLMRLNSVYKCDKKIGFSVKLAEFVKFHT